MSHHLGTLLQDQKGSAIAEALVCLPVLVALLGGTMAMHSMYAAKLEAMSRARRLAWLQADSGECPTRGCSSSACEAAEARVHANGLAGLDSAGGGGMSLRSFVGRVRDYLIGTYTDGTASAEAPLPSISGARVTVQRATTRLLCNATGRRLEEGQLILDQACATGLGRMEHAREVCR
jgi:hypothetical protein